MVARSVSRVNVIQAQHCRAGSPIDTSHTKCQSCVHMYMQQDPSNNKMC